MSVTFNTIRVLCGLTRIRQAHVCSQEIECDCPDVCEVCVASADEVHEHEWTFDHYINGSEHRFMFVDGVHVRVPNVTTVNMAGVTVLTKFYRTYAWNFPSDSTSNDEY